MSYLRRIKAASRTQCYGRSAGFERQARMPKREHDETLPDDARLIRILVRDDWITNKGGRERAASFVFLGVCREYGITILTLSFELHCAAQNRKREPRRYLICLPPNARKALSRSPGMAFPS